jgi:hypothetical protein
MFNSLSHEGFISNRFWLVRISEERNISARACCYSAAWGASEVPIVKRSKRGLDRPDKDVWTTSV